MKVKRSIGAICAAALLLSGPNARWAGAVEILAQNIRGNTAGASMPMPAVVGNAVDQALLSVFAPQPGASPGPGGDVLAIPKMELDPGVRGAQGRSSGMAVRLETVRPQIAAFLRRAREAGAGGIPLELGPTGLAASSEAEARSLPGLRSSAHGREVSAKSGARLDGGARFSDVRRLQTLAAVKNALARFTVADIQGMPLEDLEALAGEMWTGRPAYQRTLASTRSAKSSASMSRYRPGLLPPGARGIEAFADAHGPRLAGSTGFHAQDKTRAGKRPGRNDIRAAASSARPADGAARPEVPSQGSGAPEARRKGIGSPKFVRGLVLLPLVMVLLNMCVEAFLLQHSGVGIFIDRLTDYAQVHASYARFLANFSVHVVEDLCPSVGIHYVANPMLFLISGGYSFVVYGLMRKYARKNSMGLASKSSYIAQVFDLTGVIMNGVDILMLHGVVDYLPVLIGLASPGDVFMFLGAVAVLFALADWLIFLMDLLRSERVEVA